MDIISCFRQIERQSGQAFPSEFFAFLAQLSLLIKLPAFAQQFMHFRFCISEATDGESLELLPDDFIPFLVATEGQLSDYYCFGREHSAKPNGIIVFSDVTIVFDWPHYSDFLAWLQSRIQAS